ncbi:hypothetical protein [Natronorubrum tibetense]|uniref:hypothetical protein n=1 Tax=Natronorubrum tibetense TaxID=63128 RepID=UPI0012683220|nr:hypothetical protein [Natronorubrum tibetense]
MGRTNTSSQSCTIRRRSYLLGTVGVVALSGCAGEGEEENEEEEQEPEDIVAAWINDNRGDITSAFDEVEEGEDFVGRERFVAALSHFYDGFEALQSLHEDIEGRAGDADDENLSELWTITDDYLFNLSEAAASQYLAMNEMADGNRYVAITEYDHATEFYQTASDYAEELDNNLDNAIEDSIPTHRPTEIL